jgi:Sec-independent protein translocase protein TatA
MFGLGIGEIIIVVFCLLILVKPEDLPKLAAQAGKLYRQLIKHYTSLKSAVQDFPEEDSCSDCNDKEEN